jgi:tRNA nucleotidyltransferase (CCA-adding enzyme)
LEIMMNRPYTIFTQTPPLLGGRKNGVKELLKELAVRILRTLEDNGYEAYFVGGCVRDWLLGRTVHDIDICTNAHPGDVMRLFPDHFPTGLQHGTVSVRLDGQMFEVTTYRVESTYEDYRRPTEVCFVSDLQLDLERRDFTINAMAMDRFDRLRDPFRGRDDLRDRLIRAVGVAERRFCEDALRLLRAVRFAAQLDFSIEPVTLAAMEKTAPLLSHIAAERIRDELHKIVDSAAPQKGIGLIVQTGLAGFSPLLDRLFRTSNEQAWRLVHLGTLNQKWALLMYAARFDPQEARTLCRQLRMSKREVEAIAQFVGLLASLRPDWDAPRDVEWGRLLLQAGWQVCMETDNLLQACWWKRKDGRSSRSLIAAYESMPVKSLRELAVTGRDLQAALERKPGGWIQRVLLHLLEQTALHGLPNTPEALVEEARREVARHEH